MVGGIKKREWVEPHSHHNENINLTIIFIEAVNNMKNEIALSPFQKMKDAYLRRNQNETD